MWRHVHVLNDIATWVPPTLSFARRRVGEGWVGPAAGVAAGAAATTGATRGSATGAGITADTAAVATESRMSANIHAGREEAAIEHRKFNAPPGTTALTCTCGVSDQSPQDFIHGALNLKSRHT